MVIEGAPPVDTLKRAKWGERRVLSICVRTVVTGCCRSPLAADDDADIKRHILYLREVQVHRCDIAERQNETRCLAFSRTDRAEDVAGLGSPSASGEHCSERRLALLGRFGLGRRIAGGPPIADDLLQALDAELGEGGHAMESLTSPSTSRAQCGLVLLCASRR